MKRKGIFISKLDFHIHTSASDGKYSPKVVTQKAVESGATIISITDHWTFSGLRYLKDNDHIDDNLEVIPGIELEASPRVEMFHILGYFKDIPNRDAEREMERVGRFDGDTQKKWASSIGIDQSDVEGAKEVIRIIRKYEGLPALAHPFTLELQDTQLEDLVNSLIDAGLEGLEVYNSRDSTRDLAVKSRPEFLQTLADQKNLKRIPGTDYHGKGDTTIGNIPHRYEHLDLYEWFKRERELEIA